jgi:hypothetical protein
MYLNGQTPRKDFENIYVAPNAAVIGDVDLIDLNSVWYGAVLRGDRNGIFVSAYIERKIDILRSLSIALAQDARHMPTIIIRRKLYYVAYHVIICLCCYCEFIRTWLLRKHTNLT